MPDANRTAQSLTPAEERQMLVYLRADFIRSRRHLTMEEVAAILNISYSKVRQMKEAGELNFSSIGGRWIISPADLDADLEELNYRV